MNKSIKCGNVGSKLSEFVLEMYPVHGHKRLDDDAFLASLSHSRKAMVLRADASRYSLET